MDHDTKLASEWFGNNSAKLNEDKCHLIVVGHGHETLLGAIEEAKIWESKEWKVNWCDNR